MKGVKGNEREMKANGRKFKENEKENEREMKGYERK